MPRLERILPGACLAICCAVVLIPCAPGQETFDEPAPSIETTLEDAAEAAQPAEPETIPGPEEPENTDSPEPETAAESKTMIASATGLILPMPGEWFAALQRTGRPQWRTLYRPPVPGNFSYRPRIAFNLGAVFADAFLASQATDAQQVKNLGRDLVELTRGLGVAASVAARLNAITESAEHEEWLELHAGLEAALNEVSMALVQQQDQDLVTMISLGLWLRTLMVVSAVVDTDFTPERALLLRQTRVAELLQVRMEMLSPRLKKDPRYISLRERVITICTMVTIPVGELPTPQEAESIHRASSLLIEDFSRREQP